MDAIETIAERDGLTAKLYIDPEPMSPDEWDNLATFEHSMGFRFGSAINEPERGWNVYARWLAIFGDDVAGVLPVRIETGSYARAYESDSPNALLFTTHKRVTELCGEDPEYHTRERVTEALRMELSTWTQYLEGDVYGYVVETENGEHVDSCWGFYGAEYAREEATEALEYAVESRKERRQEIARGWAIAHGLTPRN